MTLLIACASEPDGHGYASRTADQVSEVSNRFLEAAVVWDTATLVMLSADSGPVLDMLAARATAVHWGAVERLSRAFEIRDVELGPCTARLYVASSERASRVRGIVEATYLGTWKLTQVRVPVEADW